MDVLENVHLMQSIFELILPPLFLLDPSKSAIPKSLWVQAINQRLDLMCVSKAWYLATWEGLYADICIQNVEQLPLLVRTVTSSKTIASRVRKVHHFAFIPACYTKMARKLFSQLVSACRNLYAVSFIYPYRSEYERTPIVAWRIPSSSRITHLHVTDFAQLCPISLRMILNNLHSQLISLTLLPSWQRPIISLSQAPLPSILSFPALTHLRWDQTYLDLVTISSVWNLPRLHHITIHQEEPCFAVFIPFFQRHGKNVTYLAFPYTRMWGLIDDDGSSLDNERAQFFDTQEGNTGPMYDSFPTDPHARSAWEDISVLLYSPPNSEHPNLCPSLVHLVLPPEAVVPRLSPPFNTTIQHIDLWSDSDTAANGILNSTKQNILRILEPTNGSTKKTGNTTTSITHGSGHIQSARFPALRSVRTISGALENYSLITHDIPPVDGFPQWALDLFVLGDSDHHRECGLTNLGSIADCFGFRVAHGVGYIREVEVPWPESEDESEDPTYVPPPDDDSAWDTDPSTSEEDSGSKDVDDADSDVEGEIGHAEMDQLLYVRF